MAVTLKQTKDYLRIDEDLTEDDELILNLLEVELIMSNTKKKPKI